MIRILVTVLVASVLGWGMGQWQSSLLAGSWEERFRIERETLAEQRGEMTADEIRQQSVGTPVVEVIGGTEHNFGVMQHGTEKSHDFVFKNTGDGPLNLEMGTSTCKCTVGDLKETVIQPGEQTVVKLTWKAQSLMSDFGQAATIITTDPVHTEVKLVVRGQIADSWVMVPNDLSFGDIADSEGASKTFHVFSYLESSKTLRDFQWADPVTEEHVDVTAKRIDIDPDRFPKHANAFAAYEVLVNVKPSIRTGPLSTKIRFSTDRGEDIGDLEMSVVARVVSDIMLVGGSSFDQDTNRLNLGTVKSSEGRSVKLWLRVKGENAVSFEASIASVTPEEALKATIEDPIIKSGVRLYPIQIEIPKGAPLIRFSGTSRKSYGKVVIKTNHEFTQEIPIHVRMVVTK